MWKTGLLLITMLFFGLARAEEPDQATHEALRGVLQGVEQAVNTQRYGDLAQYFDKDMRVTTIDQEVLTSRKDIVPYFEHWFGPGGYLKSLHMTLTADAPTRLGPGKRFGTVTGSGLEQYGLADGRHFDMKTRWTATVVRDDDGKWRILTLHIGTNFLDNPILAKAESALVYFAAGGVAVGLVLGMLIMWLWRRRRH